jgi:hypothetical protein
MKKLLALLTLGLVIFIVVYRQRIFLRDPLATVTRDGVKVSDVRAMINYSNDVLLDDQSADKHRVYLVQNWNKHLEVPTMPLRCVQGLACMTDADQAAATAITPGSRGRREAFQGVTMTNRFVEFVDEDGDLVRVTLR